MILTCPSCQKRYTVDADSLGKEGRAVKCNSCDHTWVQLPPKDVTRNTVKDAPIANEPPSTFQKPPKKPKKNTGRAWLIYFFIVFITFINFFVFRAELIAMWPPLIQVYKRLGIRLHKKEPPKFSLKKVKCRLLMQDNKRHVTVSGHLQNISNTAVKVPPLHVTIHTPESYKDQKNKKGFATWRFNTSTDRLLAGETIPFYSMSPQPIEEKIGGCVLDLEYAR